MIAEEMMFGSFYSCFLDGYDPPNAESEVSIWFIVYCVLVKVPRKCVFVKWVLSDLSCVVV